MESLEGRVIAVAGVGGGLGPLVARELGARGAAVAGSDRSEETLAALGAELGLGERWDGRAVDLLDEEAVRAWCAALVERFGRVDGVVHLVGGWRGGVPLHEEPPADWELLHDLLIRTVQNTTRAFHGQIDAAGARGRFVLVSAKQAQAPSNTNAAYAAAKAAAEAWTLAFADGFEPGGATANIIVVDAILTPRMRADNPDGDFATFTPAEELAAAIAFVCSEAAARMNGQRLPLTMR
ncbi:MAG: SDR family NAD(P)-dependent oxidoreductase [Actinobacteria bacterium]|nr:SDR family NAD(P)-dependent oxidoreductase [Actinomycetota bacterium]